MKRIISILISLVAIITFTACSAKKEQNKIEDNKITNEIALLEGTIDVSDAIDNNGKNFSYYSDIDYDGEDDLIEMEVCRIEETYTYYIDLKVGDKQSAIDLVEGCIQKVYLCDIDKTDGAQDIAILTMEVSDDPRLRIISYTDDLNCYQFAFEDYADDRKTYITDSNWIGYACSHYFNLNDDGTITIEEQTGVSGMWSVYRTYERNNHGIFKEIKPDKYEILPDFMENHAYYLGDVSNKESEMWEKGYILAYDSYENESIKIAKGEYFKPTHDDGKDKIYIEKENGEKGYLTLNFETYDEISVLNRDFFFLAG